MKARSAQKERVVVLLRASSKQQTDREHDFDIPQQKSILLPFVDSQGWELVKVFTEGGVSGFKVSASNRDAIQDIKKMADNREFDRLVIYMSDRLGRIADETPLIVSYLNQRGIIVFSSYTEGEISARDHTGKLITYIRYWQAEGESRKTSQRVSDAITQAVLQGRFRGGNIAYGYKMVNNGHNNYKGRPVLDITVDEEGEAPILRLMFTLARERNYGYRRIARYLNENNYPTRTGVLWRASQIRQILNNPCYKGYYQLNYKNGVRDNPKLISPFMPELVIISEEEWNATHEELQKHTTKSKGGKKSNHGSMLLAGIMFCGTCGRIMTSFQSKGRSKVIDGVQTYRYVPKYRCNSVYFPKENLCVGQTTYGAKKVETAVIRAIKRYMETLNTQELMTKHIKQINREIDYYNGIIKELKNSYTQISVELKTLKDEVVKSLLGTSNFDSKMLQEILSQKELEIKTISEKIDDAEKELARLKGTKQHAFYLNSKMQNWSEDFDTQEIEGKKSMLFQVVDRIELFKDRVEIIINIKMDMHKNSPASEEISNAVDVKSVSLVKKTIYTCVSIVALITLFCVASSIVLIAKHDYTLSFIIFFHFFLCVMFALIVWIEYKGSLEINETGIKFNYRVFSKSKEFNRNHISLKFDDIYHIQKVFIKGGGIISKDTVLYKFCLIGKREVIVYFYHFGKQAEHEISAILGEKVSVRV